MSKRILFILTAGILAAASIQVFAQGWGPGYGRGWMHNGYGYGHGWMHNGYGPGYIHGGYGNIDFLKAELNLTDQQTEKIVKLESEFRNQYYKNRYDGDKIAALRENHRKEIEKVLTDEQKKKFDALNSEAYRGYGRGYCCGW